MPLQDVRNVTLLVDSLPHNHCIASNAYHLPTDFECAASLACDTRCSHSARAEVLNAGCAVAVQQVPKGTGSQYFKLMIQGGLEASLSQQIVSTGRDSLICLPRKGGWVRWRQTKRRSWGWNFLPNLQHLHQHQLQQPPEVQRLHDGMVTYSVALRRCLRHSRGLTFRVARALIGLGVSPAHLIRTSDVVNNSPPLRRVNEPDNGH